MSYSKYRGERIFYLINIPVATITQIFFILEPRGGKSKHFEEDLDRISKKDTEF